MAIPRNFRRFVSDVLRDWNTGEYNMALGGDYSAAPAYYEWVAPVRVGLRQLVLVMEGVANDMADPRNFGHGDPLTVGLHFEVADDNGDDVYQLTVQALDGVNTNGDILDFFHEVQEIGGGFAAGGAVPMRRIYVWHLHDGPRGLEIMEGWSIRVLAHDDFSTRCNTLHVHIFGNEVHEIQR